MPQQVHTLGPKWNRYQKAVIPSSAVANHESYDTFLFAYTNLFVDARNLSLNSRWDWPAPAYADLSQDAIRLGYRHLVDDKHVDDKQVTYLSKILTLQAIQNTRYVIFYFDDVYRDEGWVQRAIQLLEEQIPIFKNLETVYLEIPHRNSWLKEQLKDIKNLKEMSKVRVELCECQDRVAGCNVGCNTRRRIRRRKARAVEPSSNTGARAATSGTGAGSSDSHASGSTFDRQRLQWPSPLSEQTTTNNGGLSTGGVIAVGIVALVVIAALAASLF